MEYTTLVRHQHCTITLQGKFTYHDQEQFKSILELIKSRKILSIVLDFSLIEHMDSSALGMLLILQDHLKEHQITGCIANPSEVVTSLLKHTQLDRFISITYPTISDNFSTDLKKRSS